MFAVDLGEMIVTYAKKLSSSERGIVFAPNIDVETQVLVPNEETNELLFVANASATGGGKLKTGMAATAERFYYCNESGEPKSFGWNDVEDVVLQKRVGALKSFFSCDEVLVKLKDGKNHVLSDCMIGYGSSCVIDLVSQASWAAKDVSITQTQKRSLSLDAFPNDVQLNYMKVLYNYAYITGGEVESSEYSALQSIGIRIGLPANVRNGLRSYLLTMDAREKTGVLIEKCRRRISYGSYEIFRYSLMQDALYIKEASGDSTSWIEDRFLNGLQKTLKISDEQVSNMIAAIRLHKEMLKHDVDLQDIKKRMDKLCEFAKKMEIPMETVFCSGSVYNIDTYRGIFKHKKQERSITKQRELMLQAVVRNSQESVNRLVEDMNDVTLKLVAEVQKGNQRDRVIQHLNRMCKMQEQIKKTAQQGVLGAVELRYNALKKCLSQELYDSLTLSRQELIQEGYALDSSGVYKLKTGLGAELLDRLLRIEELRYDRQ